ncbi:DNA modification methylase [Microbacterium sp. CIAB417]|uniref:DNA modification methylase n=1 Tax=Microbacterium sp. CIAB417 TaxID=2860287 RepID=UPI001FADB04F|nr:DNA modification methylase [Microbacterium sp. CIAB417]
MKSRLAASVVLSALVLTGATGCTFITPQASTIAYSASDGVNVSDTAGPVVVRNAMIIADENGELGNLVAAFVNGSQDDAVVTVELQGLEPFEVEVAAGETVSLGANEEPLLLDAAASGGELTLAPGSTVEVYFQSGDGTGAAANVPVLDGTLPYYSDLVPEPVEEVIIIDDEVAVPTQTPVPTDAPDAEESEEH